MLTRSFLFGGDDIHDASSVLSILSRSLLKVLCRAYGITVLQASRASVKFTYAYISERRFSTSATIILTVVS